MRVSLHLDLLHVWSHQLLKVILVWGVIDTSDFDFSKVLLEEVKYGGSVCLG